MSYCKNPLCLLYVCLCVQRKRTNKRLKAVICPFCLKLMQTTIVEWGKNIKRCKWRISKWSVMLMLSLALCCVCVHAVFEFAPSPSCNKLSWMFPVSSSPQPHHPSKKRKSEGNIFTAVSRSGTILIEGEIPMVLKNKNTLNDRWLQLEVKVFNRRHSQRANSTLHQQH